MANRKLQGRTTEEFGSWCIETEEKYRCIVVGAKSCRWLETDAIDTTIAESRRRFSEFIYVYLVAPLQSRSILNLICDFTLLQEKIRQAIADANLAMDVSTDSESVADASGLSDSDSEEQQVNLNELRAPLDKGWKRETVIRGLTKNGQIRGDVYYYAPGTQTRLKHIGQIQTVTITILSFVCPIRKEL